MLPLMCVGVVEMRIVLNQTIEHLGATVPSSGGRVSQVCFQSDFVAQIIPSPCYL